MLSFHLFSPGIIYIKYPLSPERVHTQACIFIRDNRNFTLCHTSDDTFPYGMYTQKSTLILQTLFHKVPL